jgi:hypothetical protein
LIDRIEDLYDFILQGFESDEKFYIKEDKGNIALSASIVGKYKSENYIFVLENKKNVDAFNEITNRMKYFQNKINKLETELEDYKKLVNSIISLDYLTLPDGSIVSYPGITKSNKGVIIRYVNKKYTIQIGFDSNKYTYTCLNTNSIKFILSQICKPCAHIVCDRLPITDLSTIIPKENIDITLKDMIHISDFTYLGELPSKTTLTVIGTCNTTVNWANVVNYDFIYALILDSKNMISGMKPDITSAFESNYMGAIRGVGSGYNSRIFAENFEVSSYKHLYPMQPR